MSAPRAVVSAVLMDSRKESAEGGVEAPALGIGRGLDRSGGWWSSTRASEDRTASRAPSEVVAIDETYGWRLWEGAGADWFVKIDGWRTREGGDSGCSRSSA